MQIKGIVWHQARELLSRLVLGYTKVAACIHPPTTTSPTTHPTPARYKPIWETVQQCACWPSHTLMHTLYFCIPYTFAYLTPLDTSMHTLYTQNYLSVANKGNARSNQTLHLEHCLRSPGPGCLQWKRSQLAHPPILTRAGGRCRLCKVKIS